MADIVIFGCVWRKEKKLEKSKKKVHNNPDNLVLSIGGKLFYIFILV